jgi:uncharacterized OB-fold protein
MTAEHRRSPLEPTISRQGAGHWSAARQGRLALQRCDDCSSYIFYPSFICDQCLSEHLSWTAVEGRGAVESFTTVYRSFAEEFAPYVPYTVALVKLREGVNLLSWLVDVDPDSVEIGMEVEVFFERISDEISLHRFRPATKV